MPSMYGMYATHKAVKKIWRYPGVPIPYRLQSKYEVKA
jgi:hypothetical protein